MYLAAFWKKKSGSVSASEYNPMGDTFTDKKAYKLSIYTGL